MRILPNVSCDSSGSSFSRFVETDPEGSEFVVNVDIDGRPAAALIDSGASHSFLNTAYVKSAGWKLLPTAEAATVLGSGDLSAPIDGVTSPISCAFGARSAVHSFRVMP